MQSTGQYEMSDSPQFLVASALAPHAWSIMQDNISLSPPISHPSSGHQGHHANAHDFPVHLHAQAQYQYARNSEVVAAATLDQMAGVRAGGYVLDRHPMASSEAVDISREAPEVYQFAPRQDSQAESGLPRAADGISRPWFDAFGGYGATSHVDSEHVGALHEGYDRVQRNPGMELNLTLSDDIISRRENQEDSGDACLSNEQQHEVLTFPEVGVDAVTITKGDLEGLEPEKCLSNNIIDFYIKYLESRLSPQEADRFYFFNSIFFTKLLGNNSASTDIDDVEVDYKQLRKWTGEVDLFEKDFVFIPILRSAHWSLIVICHLSGLTSDPDKRKGSPCVFHLDPMEGIHKSFERQLRSYIIQAWMDRHRDSTNSDQIILALACQMKYVRAKVPQQGNSYDCGLYLLQYVESFIHESTAVDFSFASSVGGPHFTSPHFEEGISAKRLVIQNLIRELSNNPQEGALIGMDTEPNPQPRGSVALCRNGQVNPLATPPSGRSKLSKKWSDEETSALLKRLVEGGRIRKGSEGRTHWNLISEDIQAKCGTIRSEDECRRRYDTLLKAYRKIKKTGKPYSNITDVERGELNLATPLNADWYNDIDRICLQRGSDNGKSRKRAKVDPSDGKGMVSSSSDNPRPSPIPSKSAAAEKQLRKQVVLLEFIALHEDLRPALLNLIHAVSMKFDIIFNLRFREAEEVCQWLAIVQDQKPLDFRRFLFKLWKLKLVKFQNWGSYNEWVPYLDLSKLRVHKKFLEEELCKYPDFDMHLEVCGKYDSASFPKAPLSLSMQRIRVLSLYKCKDVEHADLSHFPELRCLSIERCEHLKEVTGWEVVKELGWLRIIGCDSYVGFPCVQFLPSLRNFRRAFGSRVHQITPVRDFSQCLRLHSLKIDWDQSLTSVDVSTLSILEVLTFEFCYSLTAIQGLSELHSLKKLGLSRSKAMRGLPELGCLKALTRLDLSGSGVEEIAGVQELHLLTSLNLSYCSSLKRLPWLGHLKALAYLSIRESGVEEIPGVEDLVSLLNLDCCKSRLKSLPLLHHLRRLWWVSIEDTPLSRDSDPSSFYYGRGWIEYNPKMGVNPMMTLGTRVEVWVSQNPSI